MRRILAFLLAINICWMSSVTPARAFAPVAVLAAPQIVTAGASYALAALSGLVGIVGLYLTVKDAQDNASRIPMSTAPASAPPVPAAPPTDPGTSLWYYSNLSGPTAEGVCALAANPARWATQCGNVPVSGYVFTAPNSCQILWGSCSSTGITISKDSSITCPAGYTKSGSTCVLSNARVVTPDKNCDMALSNGAFGYLQDSDCPAAGGTIDHSKAVPVLRNNGKDLIMSGVDSQGRPVIITTTLSADGLTFDVKHSTQIDRNVQTDAATINTATGQVVAASTTLAPGQITTPADPSPATSAGAGVATDTPKVTTDPTKQPIPDIQTCGLPGKPACVVDDSGFSGKDVFVAPKLTEISTGMDNLKTGLENSKTAVPEVNWSWLPSLFPGDAVGCQAIPLNVQINHGWMSGFSHTENLNICDKLDVVRQILGYLLGVATIFFVWRSFAKSNAGQ